MSKTINQPSAGACCIAFIKLFFLNDPPTTKIYTLSQHDPFPISSAPAAPAAQHPGRAVVHQRDGADERSEEHTSELQSRLHLVCRLLLEKKKHMEMA